MLLLIQAKQTSIEHSTQTQRNVPSSQHLREPSLKSTTYLITKQATGDTRTNQNNPMYLIVSPWDKVRIQQHKLQKAYKLGEIEQLSTGSRKK